MFSHDRIQKAAAIACLLLGGGTAFAQSSLTDIKAMADASQFVVQSRVSKVEYRLSEAGAQGQPAVPYTLVTYDVVRSLRGAAGSAQFTLRYVGGPDGQGRFLRTSNTPVFQAGDEDILFVQGNGTSSCALAGCVDGRFRLLYGAVHDGTGAPVQRIEGTRVVVRGNPPAEFTKLRYPTPAFDDLLNNPGVREAISRQGLTVDEARRRYEAQAPASIEMNISTSGAAGGDSAGSGGAATDTAGSGAQATGQPMSVDSFVAVLASLPAAENAPAATFRSADAQAPIAAPASQPAAPARAASRSLAPKRSAADMAEERALPKDDVTITRNKAQ